MATPRFPGLRPITTSLPRTTRVIAPVAAPAAPPTPPSAPAPTVLAVAPLAAAPAAVVAEIVREAPASAGVVLPARNLPPRAQLDALVAELGRHERAARRGFFAMGVVLRAMQERQLYRVEGCANLRELCEKRGFISHMQASKLVAITQAFDEATALSLGIEKSYAVIRYARALPGAPAPHALVARDVHVRGLRAPLSRLPAFAILSAAKALGSGAPASDAEAAEKRAERLARRVGKLVRDRGAGDARVASKNRRGRWVVVLTMDLDDAARLVGETPA